MDPLWIGLADAYGSAFTNQFGDEPNDSWIGGLAGYQIEDIMAAASAIIQRGDHFAPNLATMLEHLAGNDTDWEHSRTSKSWEQIQGEPILNLGEQVNILESLEGMAARELGTPATNPNYFDDLKKINGNR